MKWLRQLFFLQRRYDDLSVSIQEHLEEKVDELMEAGMSRERLFIRLDASLAM